MNVEDRLEKELARISKIKPKPPRVDNCKQCDRKIIRSIRRGWGSCENCMAGQAIPIGKVVSAGRQKDMYVYEKSAILAELLEITGNLQSAREELRVELNLRRYLIIELYPEE